MDAVGEVAGAGEGRLVERQIDHAVFDRLGGGVEGRHGRGLEVGRVAEPDLVGDGGSIAGVSRRQFERIVTRRAAAFGDHKQIGRLQTFAGFEEEDGTLGRDLPAGAVTDRDMADGFVRTEDDLGGGAEGPGDAVDGARGVVDLDHPGIALFGPGRTRHHQYKAGGQGDQLGSHRTTSGSARYEVTWNPSGLRRRSGSDIGARV